MAFLKKRYLIADDDADDLDLLREAMLLVQPDAQVEIFFSGLHLLEYLRKCSEPDLPELVVLDYNMPDMNGAAVLEALKSEERLRTIPVLIWSTSDASHYKIECEKKGARAYFRKPKTFQQVVEMAKKMLS